MKVITCVGFSVILDVDDKFQDFKDPYFTPSSEIYDELSDEVYRAFIEKYPQYQDLLENIYAVYDYETGNLMIE